MLLRHAAAVGGGKPFRVGSWFKTPVVAWLALLEPICKLLGPFIGVCDELLPYQPFFVDGLIDHERIHALQHTLMYLSIAASGGADLLCCCHPGSMPEGLDFLVLAGGFFSQGFILIFHLTGPALDIRLHALLAVASFAAAASVALSGVYPHSSLAHLVRCACLLTLGSFWWGAGDLMFNRAAYDSNEGVAISPALYVLHVAGWMNLLVMAMVACAPARAAGGSSAKKSDEKGETKTFAGDSGEEL